MIPDLLTGAAPAAAPIPLPAAGGYTPAADGVKPSGDFADLLAATIVPEAEAGGVPKAAAGGVPQTFAVPVALPDPWLGMMLTAPQDIDTRDNGATGGVDAGADDEDGVLLDAAFTAPAKNADGGVPVPVIVQVPTDIRVAAPVDTAVDTSVDEPVFAARPFTGREVVKVASEPADSAVTPAETDAAAVAPSATAPEQSSENIEPAPSQGTGLQPVKRDAAAAAPLRTESGMNTTQARTTAATDIVSSNAQETVPNDVPAVSPAPVETAPVVKRDQVPAAAVIPQVQAQSAVPSAQQADAPVHVAPELAEIAARTFTVRGPETVRQNDAANATAKADVAIPNVMLASSPQQGGDASQNFLGNPSQDAPNDFGAAARAAESSTAFPAVSVTPAEPVAAAAAPRPAVQAAPPVETPFTPAQETENVGRLVESMRVQWRQGVPEATVRLNPEHLGEVTISIRVDRGVVSATVHAENPEVQQWLESQQDKLRNGLSDQGLNLERFVVHRDRQQQQQQQQQQQPQARYRQTEEPGPRFEVTV